MKQVFDVQRPLRWERVGAPPGGFTTDDFITNSLSGVIMKLIGAP